MAMKMFNQLLKLFYYDSKLYNCDIQWAILLSHHAININQHFFILFFCWKHKSPKTCDWTVCKDVSTDDSPRYNWNRRLQVIARSASTCCSLQYSKSLSQSPLSQKSSIQTRLLIWRVFAHLMCSLNSKENTWMSESSFSFSYFSYWTDHSNGVYFCERWNRRSCLLSALWIT